MRSELDVWQVALMDSVPKVECLSLPLHPHAFLPALLKGANACDCAWACARECPVIPQEFLSELNEAGWIIEWSRCHLHGNENMKPHNKFPVQAELPGLNSSLASGFRKVAAVETTQRSGGCPRIIYYPRRVCSVAFWVVCVFRMLMCDCARVMFVCLCV